MIGALNLCTKCYMEVVLLTSGKYLCPDCGFITDDIFECNELMNINIHKPFFCSCCKKDFLYGMEMKRYNGIKTVCKRCFESIRIGDQVGRIQNA